SPTPRCLTRAGWRSERRNADAAMLDHDAVSRRPGRQLAEPDTGLPRRCPSRKAVRLPFVVPGRNHAPYGEPELEDAPQECVELRLVADGGDEHGVAMIL